MSTAQLAPLTDDPTPTGTTPDDQRRARISFRQPVSSSGFIDAAWWPRTRDLSVELPPLLDVLWTAAREVTRIDYNIADWDPAPHRLQIEGRRVRLGGFTGGEQSTVMLSDPWRRERIDILVIAPDTDPATAQRTFELASRSDDPYRAREILELAARGNGSDHAATSGAAPERGTSR